MNDYVFANQPVFIEAGGGDVNCNSHDAFQGDSSNQKA